MTFFVNARKIRLGVSYVKDEAIDETSIKPTSSGQGGFEFNFSNQLLDFLTYHNVSIRFAIEETGIAFLVGRHQEENRLSLYEGTFNQSLGFASSADGEQLEKCCPHLL